MGKRPATDFVRKITMTAAIQLKRVCITETSLNVCDSKITYLSETLPDKVDVEALLTQLETLCSVAKAKGVKIINKSKARKLAIDNAAQYEQEYAQYLEAFRDAAALAKAIFVDKPLLVGTSENEEIQALFLKKAVMGQLWHRSTAFSKMNLFKARVNALKRNVEFIGDAKTNMLFQF
jgi:hypothetical protein